MEEIQSDDNSSNSIKSWPMDERPREKLIKEGEHRLSNTELLAILLRTGNKGQSAVELSRAILSKFKTFRGISQVDIPALKETKGLGNAKIAQIRAAIEIGRRFKEEEMKEERPKITSSKDVVELRRIRLCGRFFIKLCKIMQFQ
ncbi:hypothetical protein HY745_01320 [Candidatus Desantisbacteria bacterium]|nr:hypothetical protein [Candidatus Desantisbacteria bacterium]